MRQRPQRGGITAIICGDQREVSSPLFMTHGSCASECTKASHSLSITKARELGPVSEGGPRQGTGALRDSGAHSSPRGQLVFPLHLSELLVGHEATVPFREAWEAGSRRPRFSLHIEGWVSSSYETVGEKQTVDLSLSVKDMGVEE